MQKDLHLLLVVCVQFEEHIYGRSSNGKEVDEDIDGTQDLKPDGLRNSRFVAPSGRFQEAVALTVFYLESGIPLCRLLE
ncbi:Denticleless Protein-like [Manis pentadactyla]|nr:Denticleless Protein-like [Manis pentadactyla]